MTTLKGLHYFRNILCPISHPFLTYSNDLMWTVNIKDGLVIISVSQLSIFLTPSPQDCNIRIDINNIAFLIILLRSNCAAISDVLFHLLLSQRACLQTTCKMLRSSRCSEDSGISQAFRSLFWEYSLLIEPDLHVTVGVPGAIRCNMG